MSVRIEPFKFEMPKGIDASVSGPVAFVVMSTPEPRYRFVAVRMWDIAKPYVNFILAMPGTADKAPDDDILDRLVRRVRGWDEGRAIFDWGGVVLTCLYAWRSPDPDTLRRLARGGADVIGDPKNMQAIVTFGSQAKLCVAGWGGGTDQIVRGRAAAVVRILRSANVKLHTLGETYTGQAPINPAYAPMALMPVEFKS